MIEKEANVMSNRALLEPKPAPPEDLLSQMIGGDLLSHAIGVVTSLGVADVLTGGTHTTAELADAVGADAPSLGRFMRCLSAQRVFDELSGDRYALNEVSSLLCRDRDGSLAGWAQWRSELAGPLAAAMVHAARTGDCAFERVHRASFYEYLAGHPDLEVPWNAAMANRATRFGASMLELVDWPEGATVVDVGGHTGAMLSVVLAGTEVSGTVFDQPHLAAEAAVELDRAGFGDRSTVVGGDFFVSIPPGADLYLLANVIYDWPDDQALTILSRCREAMTSSTRLVIGEPVLTDGPGSRSAAMTDLAQFTLLGGEVRTRTAWNALLHATGLRLANLRVAGPGWSVIEATVR